jgi:hypothetical protein
MPDILEIVENCPGLETKEIKATDDLEQPEKKPETRVVQVPQFTAELTEDLEWKITLAFVNRVLKDGVLRDKKIHDEVKARDKRNLEVSVRNRRFSA